jgi:aryl-alcohol dehydrogenase-like predicted oxidoreductase
MPQRRTSPAPLLRALTGPIAGRARAIVGARSPEQVAENAAASAVELDEATLAAIEDAVAAAVLA